MNETTVSIGSSADTGGVTWYKSDLSVDAVNTPSCWPAAAPQGWQCPVCKRVNAPFISQCPCSSVPVMPMPWYPIYPPPWYPTGPWTVICADWSEI